MDTYEQNLHGIYDYIKSGIKKPEERKIGFELEHFVVDKQTHKTIGYYGEGGLKTVLENMRSDILSGIYYNDNIIGLSNEDFVITLEPASQFEISTRACAEVKEIESIYNKFRSIIKPYMDEMGYELMCKGYNPEAKADDLKLIPKNRYELMDDYFKLTGKCGKNMMRGSASTQISLDYTDENNFKRMFRAANVISPLLSLIMDNTDVFEGEIYNNYMARTYIWNNVDPIRSMIAPDALDKEFGFEEYAKLIYDSPAILVLDKSGNEIYTRNTPISEIYKDEVMNKKQIDHIMSMFFYDIRIRHYMEIRIADSVDIDLALGFAALLKSLFYTEEILEHVLEKTRDTRNHDIIVIKDKIIKEGYNANVYGGNAFEKIEILFEMAEKVMTLNNQRYFEVLKQHVLNLQSGGELYD